jgi:hypothetical protein
MACVDGTPQFWDRVPTGAEFQVQTAIGINHGAIGEPFATHFLLMLITSLSIRRNALGEPCMLLVYYGLNLCRTTLMTRQTLLPAHARSLVRSPSRLRPSSSPRVLLDMLSLPIRLPQMLQLGSQAVPSGAHCSFLQTWDRSPKLWLSRLTANLLSKRYGEKRHPLNAMELPINW